jgi:ElaB/YqjD/DUF883 family membrane-anchored ribosome-binding protein
MSQTGSSSYGGSTVQSLKEKAHDQIDKAAGQIEGAADKIAEQGREVGDNVQVVVGHVRSAVEKSLKEQPLTTLAMTAAMAFVLGAIWKS